MAIVEGQKVKIKWSANNKKHFVNKGYPFTKMGDEFEVQVEDLTKGSTKIIKVICDYCGTVIDKDYYSFLLSRKNNNIDCCVNCTDKKKKDINLNKNYSFSESKRIYLESIEKQNILPNKFWLNISPINRKRLLRFILEDFTDIYENKFTNFNTKYIYKYKIYGVVREFKTYFDFIEHLYEGEFKPWLVNCVQNGYWQDDKNKIDALKWFVDEILTRNVELEFKDIPSHCSYKLFTEFGLGGLLANHFHSSPYEALTFAFPNEFNHWDFYINRKEFHNDETFIDILNNFVSNLFNDGVINSIEDIPDKVNINTFGEYNLKSFLQLRFDGVAHKAFNLLYPDKWKVWEFKSCPTGFWEEKNNKIEAINWLLDRLIENGTLDIKENAYKLPLSMIFEEYKLSSLLNKKYDIFVFLTEEFSDIFTHDNLNIHISDDGKRMLSKEEVTVHNYLIKHFNNVKYNSTNITDSKYYNDEFKEYYVPDWNIGKHMVIEYFGYLNETSDHIRFINYREKTLRKIDYFNSLEGVVFIPIYKKDLTKSLQGVKEKLAPYIKTPIEA